LSEHPRTILQLDFDGTLVEGDASTGILERFAGPEWPRRIAEASKTLRTEPNSTALIDTMTKGYASLGTDFGAYIAHVHERHPARPGLRDLIEVATGLGMETHVVSNGFEFYIREHLVSAGVYERVAVHTGVAAGTALTYADPTGSPVRSRFKEQWTKHFLRDGSTVVYVGDGTSDIAAASHCHVVFARESLRTGLRGIFRGHLHSFDTLHDVAKALESSYSSIGSKNIAARKT
jgi:HAD superfamily phosphoserine phosphatase-like hydrolase